MQAITDILEKVRAQRTVIDGAIHLITNLRVELGEAVDAGDMARIQQIRTELDINTQALAEALVENTTETPPAPVLVPQLDEAGNPVLDDAGNPVMVPATPVDPAT